MIKLQNDAGVTKEVKVGISWTVFFFGFFVPIFRGDFKWAMIMLFSQLIVGYFTLGFGTIILQMIFVFKYNDFYINDLMEEGYKIIK